MVHLAETMMANELRGLLARGRFPIPWTMDHTGSFLHRLTS